MLSSARLTVADNDMNEPDGCISMLPTVWGVPMFTRSRISGAATLEHDDDMNEPSTLEHDDDMHEPEGGGDGGSVLWQMPDIDPQACRLDVKFDPSIDLHMACEMDDPELVWLLLSKGAAVNQATTRGITPLYLASKHGHTTVVLLLLSEGATVGTSKSNGATPLFAASKKGRNNVASLLLSHGAVVDQPKHDGSSPLLVACHRGHAKMVSLLLSRGAKVNQAGKDGLTPLYAASHRGHTEVVSLLLAHGAAAECGRITPLYAACHRGHTETVSLLLSQGAGVDAPGSVRTGRAGLTPLYAACHRGHTETAALLLSFGAATDLGGVTPLYAACHRGHAETAALLLSSGAKVDHCSMGGTTALHVACQEGCLACVQLLSSYGASRSFSLGILSAEEVVARVSHAEVLAWLVESRLWSTPLHHLEVVSLERAHALLHAGADLDAADSAGGPTPVSLAQGLHLVGRATEGSTARLVMDAAAAWSERTHELFPAASRARAVDLMLLGHRFSRQTDQWPCFFGQEVAFFDAWMQHMMPHAIHRQL
jgi:ankyrin repeat protein